MKELVKNMTKWNKLKSLKLHETVKQKQNQSWWQKVISRQKLHLGCFTIYWIHCTQIFICFPYPVFVFLSFYYFGTNYITEWKYQYKRTCTNNWSNYFSMGYKNVWKICCTSHIFNISIVYSFSLKGCIWCFWTRINHFDWNSITRWITCWIQNKKKINNFIMYKTVWASTW